MKYLIISSLLFLMACSGQVKKEPAKQKRESKIYFFEFDKVDHYFIDIQGKELDDLTNYDLSKKELSLKAAIVLGNELDELEDTGSILELEGIGFERRELPHKMNVRLNDLFSEVSVEEVAINECEPIYRDVLVFKKEGKIIGLSKICFQCNQYTIAGSAKNTWGINNRLKHLKKLIE